MFLTHHFNFVNFLKSNADISDFGFIPLNLQKRIPREYNYK
jgi:hypothetical protein